MGAGGRSGRVRGAWGLVALGALAAGLGACTDDGPDTPPADRAAAAEVVEGGTIRLGLGGPVVADPVDANLGSPEHLLVLDLLHDGLTRIDADGEVVPALAAEWRHDEALRTWTFTLDPDATFSTGEPVTAADVVASLERVARAGDSSLAALQLEPVTGFRAFVAGEAPNLGGLSAPDERTVQIALDAPVSTLPQLLAAAPYGVVDADALDAAGDAPGLPADAGLTGAWEVASSSDDELRLTRRAGVSGHLDGVALVAFEDGEAAYAAFQDGEVDWALVPAGEASEGEGDEDEGDEVDEVDEVVSFHAEVFFGLRLGVEPFTRPELRQAIAAAIDREAIVEEVYEGLAVPLASVVPAGVPGHDPDRCGACGHDPDRARELLAAAYPVGSVPEVAIDFDDSPRQEEMAALVAEQLEEVGIPTQLRPRPLDEYKQLLTTGEQRLFSFGWIGVYRSPDAYLAPLFASLSNDNLTGLASSEADDPLVAARSTADAAAAAEHWATVEAFVLERAVVVPIAQFRIRAAVADRVRGLIHAVDGSVDWSQVWLADGA